MNNNNSNANYFVHNSFQGSAQNTLKNSNAPAVISNMPQFNLNENQQLNSILSINTIQHRNLDEARTIFHNAKYSNINNYNSIKDFEALKNRLVSNLFQKLIN